jgi:hypothetical protein
MRVIKIIIGVLLLWSAAGSLIAGVVSFITPEMGPLGVILITIGGLCAWGGIKLVKQPKNFQVVDKTNNSQATGKTDIGANMNNDTFAGQLDQFGIKIDFMTRDLYTKIAALIPDGEKILYALEGLSGSKRIPVIITAKNVYLMARAGIFGADVASIPISRITSVTAKGGAFLGLLKNLYIAEGTVVHEIEKVDAPMAEKAIAAINQAQAQAAAPASAVAPLSQADELAKFKKLLDDGVLTREEFDKKKAQILGL